MAADEHPDLAELAALRELAGPERWDTIVTKADRHAAMFAAVKAAMAAGASLNKAVQAHGVALALLLAADVETGVSLALAGCVAANVQEAKDRPVNTELLIDDRPDRGEHGVFTAQYNARWRQGVQAGTTDSRWQSDADMAALRNPVRFRIGQVRETTLATKLLAMGAAPLLTTQRGFVESLTALPVTVTTTHTTRTYTLGTNPRQPKLTPVLVTAAAEITRRKLSDGGRLLIFQVAEAAGPAPNARSP